MAFYMLVASAGTYLAFALAVFGYMCLNFEAYFLIWIVYIWSKIGFSLKIDKNWGFFKDWLS